MKVFSKTLTWLSLLIIFLSVAALFYKSVVLQDFTILDEESVTEDVLSEIE